MNNGSFLSTKIEDYNLISSYDEKFEYNEFDKYHFPYEKKVPEGWYHSIIMDIKWCASNYGKKCYEVSYKIFPYRMHHDYENKMINNITYFYIRQKYIVDGEHDRALRTSIREDGNKSDILWKDLKNQFTECILIEYKKDGEIGSITQRFPSILQNVWFVDDISDDYHYTIIN